MYYIFVRNGQAQESIPEFDPAFPDVPIDQRYQKEFLMICVKSNTPIPTGWYYNPDTNKFTEETPFPPPPEPEMPPSIDELTEALNILLGGRDDELDEIIGD